MHYTFSAKTDPGRVRDNNEDAIFFDPSTGLVLLADGMGGYQAGEVASDMAVEFFSAELGAWLLEVGEQANAREVRRAMEICADNANQAICQAARACPQYAGMGTTLVAGVFQGQRLVLGHVGDSRCYRFRQGDLRQITRDHSLLQEQIDAGLITPAQAAASVHKNLLTRALGVEQGDPMDLNDFQVESGDIHLMCSDGLTDMVSDASIAQILHAPHTLDQLATRLVELANREGGRDNVSVILIRAEG